MSGSVIVAGARTPIGRLLGGLKDQSAADLGGVAIKGALEKAGVSGDQVDYVIMGQVIQAGAGQITARQAAHKGGIPLTVPSITINKVCLSGINAIAMADQLIRAGEHEIVVAGGMESMTQAPHLLPKSREGFKYGDVDAGRLDGLRRALRPAHRPADGRPHRELQRRGRAADPRGAGRVLRPVAPARRRGVEERRVRRRGRPGRDPAAQGRPGRGLAGRGHPRRHHRRVAGQAAPGVRQGRHDHRRLRLADLRRRLRGRGDEQGQGRGARADLARRDRRLRPGRRARLDAADAAGQRDREGRARKEGIAVADLDLVEINEAFAAVGIVSARELGLAEDKVNVNGGAIALGHPVGMSGARIALHLALELKRRGGGTGAAALCGGGGQGDALILHVPA